jgi:hypothetical protein
MIRPISDRKIVCAANMFEDGTIIIGVRHWDLFMHKQADAYGLNGYEEHVQGFIDQFGDFWDREEALNIIKASGQQIDPERNSHHKTVGECVELYSEGLY